MTDNKRIHRKAVKIVVKRQYVGTSDMQKLFSEVIKRALLKNVALDAQSSEIIAG